MSSFDTVLVANRGEIARRVFRTARDMGLRTVAVFVDVDADAPFVSEADEAVRLADGGYLDGAAVIDAAHRSGAGAIHPGYGFLSENAGFAAAVIDAGITWIGPSPGVIEAMGDKLAAKRLAGDAEVPVLPSAEDVADAESVGYPLLVKAAAGGGGKGMRVVEDPADLDDAVAAARREAETGFGDDRVFLERYVPRARHVEIQIMGDRHGRLVHFGERECSIQRRHQKIIEESPSPVIDDERRTAMGAAALRLAGALGYESAGTVEFLVDDDSGEFWFLEVNTRLQVEHPVTEEVTGIDLVRTQIQVARDEPLAIDQDAVVFAGHAVEARLYAENPAAGFLPATGVLDVFEPAAEPWVRWDSGVESASAVGLDFDPMLAKVIAHAPTRHEAASRLALALERLHLGGVTTNRDFLVATLRSEAFLAGDTTTDFIERVAPARSAELSEADRFRVGAAAALWVQGRNRADATVLETLPSGFRNSRMPAEQVTFIAGEHTVTVDYRARRDGSFAVGPAGATVDATVHRWSSDGVDIEIDGRRGAVLVAEAGDRLHVASPWGHAELVVVPRFAPPAVVETEGSLVAPMPGSVLEVAVAVGDRVEAGQLVVVLEAMKMEHRITAPQAGVVADVPIRAGDQVDNGALLVVVEAEDASTEEPS